MTIQISHNWGVFLWFLGYVGLIFVFAAFYFRFYRHDPTSFAFTADVRNAQQENFKKRTNDQLFVLASQIEVFCYLSEKLRQNQTPTVLAEEKINVRLSEDASFRMFMSATNQGQSNETQFPTVAIMGRGDVELKRFPLFPHSFWARWDDALERYESKAIAEKRLLEQRLVKFEKDPFDVWTYSDFVYFSAICQSTVGFGDILPNSKKVRKLVVVQIILGYLILVVAINILVGTQPASATKDSSPIAPASASSQGR